MNRDDFSSLLTVLSVVLSAKAVSGILPPTEADSSGGLNDGDDDGTHRA